MKLRAVHWLWLLAVGAVLCLATGCATHEVQNASTRPWDTPQGWEGGIPLMDQQHP